jgi:hypothetical protein
MESGTEIESNLRSGESTFVMTLPTSTGKLAARPASFYLQSTSHLNGLGTRAGLPARDLHSA